MDGILPDSCVFIPLWINNPPSKQYSGSTGFIEAVRRGHYKVHIIPAIQREIGNKFPYILSSFKELYGTLKSEKKLVDEVILKSFSKRILELQKDAQNNGFDLSFADSTLAFLAKEKKLKVCTWDRALNDYCDYKEIPCDYPNNLYKE